MPSLRRQSDKPFDDFSRLIRSPQSRLLVFQILGVFAGLAVAWVLFVAILSLFNAWGLIGLTIILGGVVFYFERQRKRRQTWIDQGLCGGCGYDLRASPERCPECGRLTSLDEPAWRKLRREWKPVQPTPVPEVEPPVPMPVLPLVPVAMRTPNFHEGPIPLEGDENTSSDGERQVTSAACGHILTNINVWSPDSSWLVYDVRSDPSGVIFDGTRIERVNVHTSQVQLLYQSIRGANCGAATCNAVTEEIAFILGPEDPTPDWTYAAYHRRGVIVEATYPGIIASLDACDYTPPFTPGALRGGSHVHVFDGQGQWVSFTYEDAVLSQFEQETPEQQINLRGVGVSVPRHPVAASSGSIRNVGSDYFSVLVTRLNANPPPGSDEISKAFEEGWVGTQGYLRSDGNRQQHALVFQGQVRTSGGGAISEVFIVDLPDDLTRPGDGPLEGTQTHRPLPPLGCVQRRLTHTENRKYPGIAGPRHWLRSSPDGSRIAFLMKDDDGIVQLFTVSPNGGSPAQLTRNAWSIASAFSWSPDGRSIACVIDNSVFAVDTIIGSSRRLTPRSPDETAPRPEACVFSPDGKSIAYVRRMAFNQIFVVAIE